MCGDEDECYLDVVDGDVGEDFFGYDFGGVYGCSEEIFYGVVFVFVSDGEGGDDYYCYCEDDVYEVGDNVVLCDVFGVVLVVDLEIDGVG